MDSGRRIWEDSSLAGVSTESTRNEMRGVADLRCDQVGYVCILCLCELLHGILDHREEVSFPLWIVRSAQFLDASRALLEPRSRGMYPGIDIIGC